MKNPVLDEYTVLTATIGEVYDVHDVVNKVYEPVRIEGWAADPRALIFITRVRLLTADEKRAHLERDGEDIFDYDWAHIRPTEGLSKHVALFTREAFAEIFKSGNYELD